ncbi:MAG: hypothetical protein JJ895_06480 [Balneolaceae bacterium]|nr:hypothetical protein [Balneolaceae bacterium]
MKAIFELISTLQGDAHRLNPTEIYNEGWMTRLLVYHSVEEKLTVKDIAFGELSNWTSEGLISSPFVFADKYREGYTHADMALGDFSINFEQRGEIIVNDDAKLFGIIEAKMGSPLSKGTTNAPNYNQASRNIACIAYNTRDTNINSFFGVVAPLSTLDKHEVAEKLKSSFYARQIEDRYDMYEEENAIWESKGEVYWRVLAMQTFMISYEEWIEAFDGKECHNELNEFYSQCLKWNRIKA